MVNTRNYSSLPWVRIYPSNSSPSQCSCGVVMASSSTRLLCGSLGLSAAGRAPRQHFRGLPLSLHNRAFPQSRRHHVNAQKIDRGSPSLPACAVSPRYASTGVALVIWCWRHSCQPLRGYCFFGTSKLASEPAKPCNCDAGSINNRNVTTKHAGAQSNGR